MFYRGKRTAAAGLAKSLIALLVWLGLPAAITTMLALLVFIFFFGYAGLAQNLTQVPVHAENKLGADFTPTELSAANKKLVALYKETAYNTVPDNIVKDHYRQETAYRLSWGLLAALDTIIFQLDERRTPAENARLLMSTRDGKPLFEYKDSLLTVKTTVVTHTRGKDGIWQTSSNTKTERRKIKLLTLARTFAGEFQHLYKETTTTETTRSGGGSAYSVTTTVTTKEKLTGIDATPSGLESLRQILTANGLNDNTDLELVFSLADTYDEAELEPDGTTKNFWKVAMEQDEWPAGTTAPVQGPSTPPPVVPGGGDKSLAFWPTPGFHEISSPFGMRIHPIKKISRMHTGIDIAAPGGTPIIAAAAGTVITNRYSNGYGNQVVINHGEGLITSYNHMRVRSGLKVGEEVKAGQTVGEVGSTGMSTGNHLHFEVRLNGRCRDPLDYY